MKTNALCPIQVSLDQDQLSMPIPVIRLMTYLQAPTSPSYLETPSGQQLLKDIGSALVEEWMSLCPFPMMPDLLMMQFQFITTKLHVHVMLSPDKTISLQKSGSTNKEQFIAAMHRLDELAYHWAESAESFLKVTESVETEEQQALSVHFLKTYEMKVEARLTKLNLGFQWTSPMLSFPNHELNSRPQVVPSVGLFFRSKGEA